MITPEDEKELYREMYEEFAAFEKEQKEKWNKAKEELKDLIHPKYFAFLEDHETYQTEGVFEIEETDRKENGYEKHKHCSVKNWSDGRLFIHHETTVETLEGDSEYEGEDIEYWVWQTCGYLGDDFSGYLLVPLNNGKYWMTSYSC